MRFLWHRDNGKVDQFYDCDTLNSNPAVCYSPFCNDSFRDHLFSVLEKENTEVRV